MIKYKVHIQNKGWTDWYEEGRRAGTSGEGLRLEAIIIQGVDSYRVHVQDQGWTDWIKAGEVAGTVGEGKRIEAIEIKGKDLNYQVHVQNIGWMDFARSGEMAGSEGGGLRIEAIRMLRSEEPIEVDDPRTFFKVAPKPKPIPVSKPLPNQPSQVLKGKIFVVDAGHGGSDPGAVGNMTEKEQNLQVALNLGQLLKNHGATVILTRCDDRWMSLSERVAIANDNHVDAFISIHHNGSGDPSAHGSETICHPLSSGGYKLAKLILDGLTSRLGTRARRVIQRDDYTVTYTNMVAVISEASFTSNPNEVHQFRNGGMQLEAQGILDGVLAYYS